MAEQSYNMQMDRDHDHLAPGVFDQREPVSVELYVSSSAADTDFTAKLVDVHPAGFRTDWLSAL
jgi:hypothetical protein